MLLFLSPGSMVREIDRGRRPRRGATRRRGHHFHWESLETRITPSTWTGAGANSNWSTGANWSGGAVPGNGDSLLFPSGVAHLNAVNDLPAGMSFNSIEIDGSGYALSGNAIRVVQGITTTYSSGASSDAMDTQLGGTVSVGTGGELDLGGAITGAAGLAVAGGGTLGLGGSTSNSYGGTTTVDGSTLVLSKSGGAIAVPGDLVIGDGTTTALVRQTAAAQTKGVSNLTINDLGTLDLNGKDDSIGGLTMTGGTITTGAGTLTLGGDVTVKAPANSDASSIIGNLDLGGAARTFTVANGPAATDLSIPAVVSNSTAGVTITGRGTVDLSGKNTYTGPTTIAGPGTTLLVDGTVGAVGVHAGATLGGSGTVGNVNSTGGTVSPGDGLGPLNTGSLTLDTSSSFAPQLNGPATVAFGQAVASGAVTLGGTLNATLGGGYVPTIGDQLTIIRNNSGSHVIGTFTGLPEGSTATIDGRLFKISYQGGAGSDVVLTDLGIPTTTTVSASKATATYGLAVTFTAFISGGPGPAPTGSIAFYDGNPSAGGTLLGTSSVNNQGVANFTTTKLKVAGSPHAVFARYSGSQFYVGSTTAQSATVTITPATVTASLVGTVTKTYDGTTAATLSGGNYQLSGVVNNDNVSLNFPTSGTYDTKDVGTSKMVSVSGLSITGADAGNYVLGGSSLSTRVGVINAKSVTVSGVTAQDKVYDGTKSVTINVGAATLSGVLPGETVALGTGGAVGSFADPNAGTGKPVIVTGLSLTGADSANYTIAPVAGVTATISPAPLIVAAKPAMMTYGGTVPGLAYTAAGFVGSDKVGTALTGTLATAATSKSHVGSYPITQGTLAAVNGNYSINFSGANLSVTPAPLTIKAADVSKVYGAPVPALTAVYSGFKNQDTAASLTTPPSLTTSATSTSPVGTYSINVAGASSGDYTISYVPGTLTIAKASTSAGLSGAVSTSVVGQDVAFAVQVAPVGPGAGRPTGTVTFLVDGNPIATASVDTATGRAAFSSSSLGRGTHTITASYSGDSSFASSQSGSTQETVVPAGTQTVLTTQAIRNTRGRITAVNLVSQVLVVPPGAGVPTGVVTFFRKSRRMRTVALSDGRAVLRLKPNQVTRKPFTIEYGGDANFGASRSSSVVPTTKSLRLSARPLTALFSGG